MQSTQHKTVNRAASFKPAATLKPVQARSKTSQSTIGIQTALNVSSPSDPAEKEAESSAKKVMRMQVPESSITSVKRGNAQVFKQTDQQNKKEKLQAKWQSPYIARFASASIFTKSNLEEKQLQRKRDEKPDKENLQRKADSPSEKEKPVQRQRDKSSEKDQQLKRKVDGQPDVASGIASELKQNMSNGKPLPLSVRRFMEPRFKADFSQVKIHTDDRAAKLSRGLNAQAFTLGNQIFFGKGKFKPESDEGKELIAHELTHTVQQGAAIQRREAVPITQSSPPQVQRLGISDAWDYFADKANLIPGFRMFTIVLGMNPINRSSVDRSAANVMRAVIEFIPGGGFITQALDNHGIFDKVSLWVGQQIQTLGMIGSAIRQAVSDFLGSLGWRDIFSLGSVWSRAKKIFTSPITKIINFVKGLVSGIVTLIKDAILRPIASLAEGTRGYDLLKAVLGYDPITGDPVPRTPETLMGGFMKLIGQEEVWNNLQQANAIPRAWAWFQGAMVGLFAFVVQIPSRFLAAFTSLTLLDIILLPRAFAKIVGVFATFIGQFIVWAGNTVWNLLEIIFAVVAPGVMPYIQKAAGAFRSILQKPIAFVGNLVRAAKRGFQQFAAKIAKHLRNSLIQWLTGAMGAAGLYIPQSFSFREIIKFVLSVLGLTWKNIRVKLVRVVGEGSVKAMETGFELVSTLVREGPAAAWEKIKEGLSNLKEIVITGIMNFVVTKIVQKAVLKLVMMINPAGAVIQAIIAIYNTIMFFVERLRQIIQVATAFINSISAIASGVIKVAANRVEQTLAGMLTLAISFLARFAGLGKVSTTIMKIINKIRAPINKALDKIVIWIVKMARKLGRFVAQAGVPKDPKKRLKLGVGAAVKAVNKFAGKRVGNAILKPLLSTIKIRYGLTKLETVAKGGLWRVFGEINPTSIKKTDALTPDGAASDTETNGTGSIDSPTLNEGRAGTVSANVVPTTSNGGGRSYIVNRSLFERYAVREEKPSVNSGRPIVMFRDMVGAHLLSQKLGGPGNDWNLANATRSLNSGMSNGSEKDAKVYKGQKKYQFKYISKATYHNNGADKPPGSSEEENAILQGLSKTEKENKLWKWLGFYFAAKIVVTIKDVKDASGKKAVNDKTYPEYTSDIKRGITLIDGPSPPTNAERVFEVAKNTADKDTGKVISQAKIRDIVRINSNEMKSAYDALVASGKFKKEGNSTFIV